MTTLREGLIKIGSQVVTHARYVVFETAEVAVTRWLFRAILDQKEVDWPKQAGQHAGSESLPTAFNYVWDSIVRTAGA